MWGRFIDVFRRRRLDADLDAQLAHHLEALEAEYRAQGLAPDEARAAARRAVADSLKSRTPIATSIVFQCSRRCGGIFASRSVD